MSKLKRCPCCKGKAELLKGTCELDNYVMCLDCKLRTRSHNTKEGAIKAWNTRKPMERIVERLEEYEGTYVDVDIVRGIVKEEGGV